MKKIINFHTHNHTIASDGANSLLEMARAAKENNIDLFVLSDHNTLTEDIIIREVEEETGCLIVKGIEYTTFWGHSVSFGGEFYPWTMIKRDKLHLAANYGYITGIAHPYTPGDPLCTGCNFNFIDLDYSSLDYIEVYHGNNNIYNEWEKNKDFYLKRLNEGYKLSMVFAGDYHGVGAFKGAPLINVMEIKAGTIDEMKKDFLLNFKAGNFHIASPEYTRSKISIKSIEDLNMELCLSNFPKGAKLLIISPVREILSETLNFEKEEELINFKVEREDKAILAEIYYEDRLIGASNPFFI